MPTPSIRCGLATLYFALNEQSKSNISIVTLPLLSTFKYILKITSLLNSLDIQ